MDILNRLRDSSPNEGSHELQCRCMDAAYEIERLQRLIDTSIAVEREACASLAELCDDQESAARFIRARPNV